MTQKELKVTKQNNKKLLQEYASKLKRYNDFSATIRRLVLLFLSGEEINTHSVSHRAKDVYSLKQKIKIKLLKGKSYNKLEEVPDLAGIRVVLFFKDDIERVKKIINKEFFVHKSESVDKGEIELNTERINGYSSVHRVVSINQKRLKLREYSQFKNMRCEIQVRTILQNAWAEIEHGIGYKPVFVNKKMISSGIHKAFVETARQLEQADENFSKIYHDYEVLTRKYAEKIYKDKSNVPINLYTLEIYLNEKLDLDTLPLPKKKLLLTNYMEECKQRSFKTIKDLDSSDLF